MRKQWTNEMIISGIQESMEILNIDRMPTGEEFKAIGRNDLHCKISRTLKYSGWAERMGLELKAGTTRTGHAGEEKIMEVLIEKGFQVERTSTKHPYDLLVNDCVKIDVKMANLYTGPGSGSKGAHMFHLAKELPTCDIYIMVALNAQKEIEKIFIVPSHHVKKKTVSMGNKTIYDKYLDQWELIERYADFFKSIE